MNMVIDDLVAAVLRDPDCDTVRLACADAYDELGDHSRAEFVRLQVAGTDFPRQRRLLKGFGKRWVSRGLRREVTSVEIGGDGVPFQNCFRKGYVELRWHRGWIDDVRCSAGEVLRVYHELSRIHPVTAVVVSGVSFQREQNGEFTIQLGGAETLPPTVTVILDYCEGFQSVFRKGKRTG